MSKQAPDLQYTIRGIPREVDRVLRRKASRGRKSLNQVVVEELIAATTGARKRADFSDITGKWVADSRFDEIIATQREIDPDKWR